MLRCILYPHSHLFVTTGGKDQAASIVQEKSEQLMSLIPGLKNELSFNTGATKTGKEDFQLVFKNGSKIDVFAASERTRGKRATGGLIEEAILVDGDILNTVLIPTMNVDRRLSCGLSDNKETANKSQVYVTTAGWKSSFAYEKLIEVLLQQIVAPDKAMTIGGTWKVPVMEGLLDKNFVNDLRLSGTYNDSSFAREYGSEWAGSIENSFFRAEKIDSHRVLNQPEHEASTKRAKDSYYVLGVDVGRLNDKTEVVVIKVTPQLQNTSLKSIVNIYSIKNSHFEDQVIEVKKIAKRFNVRRLVVDGNGPGIGFIDYLVKSQVDADGVFYEDYGIYNDDEGRYRQFRTSHTWEDVVYIIKANAALNTEAHSYIQTQLNTGKIRFLLDDRIAKDKLMNSSRGQKLSPDERARELMPFTLTTALREQMLNLADEGEGTQIKLKQVSKKIKKDKFSAIEYGLFYIKTCEENGKKKRKIKLSQLTFLN